MKYPHKKRISQLVFRSIVLGLAVGFASTAHANPLAPNVVNGTATIATSGNTMTVTNTPGAIINWQQFNIGQSEVLKFIQQSAQSSVLNRVLGQDPSLILGTLQSNGRVFLINPSGVMFGQGSVVNVNGLVASTLNISDSDFLLNRFNFIGSNGASVINKGEISTPVGGSVYLIGNSVSNEGVITSPQGEIILAAGNSVSLLDTGTPHVTVTLNAPDNQAVNLGQIVAEGGNVNIYGALLSQQGVISADSASLDAQGNIVLKATQGVTLGQDSKTTANGLQGGTVTVQAGGTTTVSGTVQAEGSNGKGGTINLLGNNVILSDTAQVDVSGATGGGTVLVGGDFQGKNAAVQNAQYTDLAQGASIKADATNAGDGGKVIVWADEATRAQGTISARGGANGGNGGFVEVSGKQHLQFAANVDTRAPLGQTGTLLLDPTDITIVGGSSVPAGGFAGGTFTGAGNADTIGWTEIEAQLAGTNVIIQTSSGGGGLGDITINGSPTTANFDITHTSPYDSWTTNYGNMSYSSPNNLSLLAENSVIINAPFGNAGTGGIEIIAGWNGNLGAPDLVANYTANKDIVINAFSGIVTNGALTLKAADSITLYAANGDAYIDMTGGTLTMVANTIALDATTASASNYRARIQTNGDQSFTLGRPGGGAMDGLFLGAGNGGGIYNAEAQIQRYAGTGGGQSFTFNNGSDLIMAGGTGDGLDPGGSFPGYASWNRAKIDNYGDGNQTFNFVSGGSIQLLAGSGGNGNEAAIESETAQVVSGNPAITLQGGASGGTILVSQDLANDAGMESGVSQTIDAASITMSGGASAYGAAWMNAPLQNISVIGNVNMTAGSAPAPSALLPSGELDYGSSVFLGWDAIDGGTSHTLNLTLGGSLTLQGGAVNQQYGGQAALIGGYNLPSNVMINSAGNILLQGAMSGSDMIGSFRGNGGSVSLITGGSITLGQGFVGTGTSGYTIIYPIANFSLSSGGQIVTGNLQVGAVGAINLAGTVNTSGSVVLGGSAITISAPVTAGTYFISSSGTFDLYSSITANGVAATGLVGPWSSSTGKYLQSEVYVTSAFTNHGGTFTTPNGEWIVTLGDGVVGSSNAIGSGPVSYADVTAHGYFWSDPSYAGLFGNFHFYHSLPSTSAPIDPCQVNPSACTDTTVISNFDNFLSGDVTKLAVSGAAGDVTFDPSLKEAEGEITFTNGTKATAKNGVNGAVKSARGEAKQAEDDSQKADVEVKKAEAEEKAAKTPQEKARAKKVTEKKKLEAEEKKAEAEEKKAVAEAKEAEAEAKTAQTSGEKAKAEVKKTEAEGKKAEAESRKAEAEAKKADVEVKQAERDTKKAEAEAKGAKTPEEKVRAEKSADASKAEAQGKKADVAAKKSESEAKKAEAEVKKADVEAKTAKTSGEKAKAEVKKTEAEGKKAEAESRKAEAEAKKADVEVKQSEGDTKRAEVEAKIAKTPEEKAQAEKRAESSKADAQEKKADVVAKKSESEAKKAEAEAKKAEVEAKGAKTEDKKVAAETKKIEAESKKAEAESKKAEAESRKAEVEVKKAEGEAKDAKSPEKKVEAEKKAEAKKSEAEAKKAESESKRSEVEAKKAEVEVKKAEAEVKAAKSSEKKAEAEKKAENKKAEAENKKAEVEKKKDAEVVKKAEAQKKETEHKKAEAERKEAAIKAFSKTTVALATKDHVKNMMEIRHEYKTDVLKPALTILDRNPAAADMSACGAGSAGACIQQPTAQMATLLQPPSIPAVAFLPQIQRKIAVVIGVNKYQDKSIPPLEGAVPDADAVGKMLQEKMGYEVRVVHNGTKAEIVDAINRVAGDVGANDSVTIYYAGHGYEVESTKTGYWIPSDGSAKSPANWISNRDINKMLSNVPAKQVMLVSDSCFSGTLAQEQKVSAVKGTAQDILGKRSVLVMSSGGEEPVSDEGRDGHSVFAWHFMDNLKNVSKYEQGSNLYEGVKTGIAGDGFPQSPQYGASVTAGHSTGGDYLFEVRKY